MLRRFAPHAGNLLTALRVVLTPVFIVAVQRAEHGRLWGAFAVLVFAAVAASDVWDGRAVRRWGRESRLGRFFDHFADIAFLLPALSVYVWLGIMPWWVPASVAAGFTFYVVDSQRRTAGAPPNGAPPNGAPPNGAPPNLITSRIGHVGGVCNYVLVGVLVCNHSAGINLLPGALLQALYCMVPTYSAAAVVARLLSRRVAAPALSPAGLGS
jgi:phosphatidylglycerophosphate synthase